MRACTFFATTLLLMGCGGGAALEPPDGASPPRAEAGTGGGEAGRAAVDAGPSEQAAPAAAAGGAGDAGLDEGEADAGEGGVGQGGDGSPVDAGAPCGLRVMKLEAIDSNGDGLFKAGELIQVQATVEDTADAAGPVVVRFASDDPATRPEGASEVRVASFVAGTPRAVAVGFRIAAAAIAGWEIGFSATASLADDPTCASPAIEPVVVTTGSATSLHSCDEVRQIVLHDPRVAGVGGLPIAPGALMSLAVIMTNRGSSAVFYPQINVTSDNPGVTEKGASTLSAYLLTPGASTRSTATMNVDASLPHGTLVHLTAAPGPLNGRCRNLATIEVPVLVP